MEILGNMQLLSSCSRVLNGYCGCKGSQRYQNWSAMLNLVFVAPKFRLRRVQKRGREKRAKNEKSRFAKNTFLFLRVNELDIILGVNTDRKNRVGKKNNCE